MNVLTRGACLTLLLALAGCIDTVQREARVELKLAGTDISKPFAGRDGASISLSRAQLAFGPLTLCAGREAGDLCDDALAEWRESAVVDALDPEPKRAGELVGITGSTRSYMYDLGIVSLLTQQQPVPLAAARELSGHSVWLEGTVELRGRTVPFRARLAMAQSELSARGVPIVRKSPSERFAQRITAEGQQLLIRFDPRDWVVSVDFAALLANGECSDAAGPRVCSGNVAQVCAADGTVMRTRDCSLANEVCVSDLGCVERLEFRGDDQASLAIRNELLAGGRPVFKWSTESPSE